jgi:hypothetical protein
MASACLRFAALAAAGVSTLAAPLAACNQIFGIHDPIDVEAGATSVGAPDAHDAARVDAPTDGRAESGAAGDATTDAPASAPATPANVQVFSGRSKVLVEWKASAGATAYRIYSGTSATDTNPRMFDITDATATSSMVTGLADKTRVFIAVTALTNGAESDKSPAVAANTYDAPVSDAAALQAAIAAATPGEIVTIAPGVYDVPSLHLTQGVSLVGSVARQTVLRNQSPAHYLLYMEHDPGNTPVVTTIEGLTFEGVQSIASSPMGSTSFQMQDHTNVDVRHTILTSAACDADDGTWIFGSNFDHVDCTSVLENSLLYYTFHATSTFPSSAHSVDGMCTTTDRFNTLVFDVATGSTGDVLGYDLGGTAAGAVKVSDTIFYVARGPVDLFAARADHPPAHVQTARIAYGGTMVQETVGSLLDAIDFATCADCKMLGPPHFVNYSADFTAGDLHVKDTSSAKHAAGDGTELGAYGGPGGACTGQLTEHCGDGVIW